MAKKSMDMGGDMCSCKCHGMKHWVGGLSLVLLGAAGLWWNMYVMDLLYWLLLINGLVCLAKNWCKCC